MRLALLSTIAVFLSAVAPALAQGPDPAVGRRLAEETCASCHAVGAEPDAKSPDSKAPRFLDVAKMPSTTELSLKVFLRSSHRNMPNFLLSPEETDGVAAYILGLKKK
ncbi:c-type cytochrome [Methylocystis sp. JAN1]|uniref:c-type cytochrome n=1 Tax=Methylocystis sp. JAN1 TaxID=3397211 RepID=UPI003FA2C590